MTPEPLITCPSGHSARFLEGATWDHLFSVSGRRHNIVDGHGKITDCATTLYLTQPKGTHTWTAYLCTIYGEQFMVSRTNGYIPSAPPDGNPRPQEPWPRSTRNGQNEDWRWSRQDSYPVPLVIAFNVFLAASVLYTLASAVTWLMSHFR
jgi:hypothetical protein